MASHAPYPCQKQDADVERELQGDGEKPGRAHERPVLQPLQEWKARPLRWLLPGKIPQGKLTLIEGPPAVGKLLVALDLAAQVSLGRLVPPPAGGTSVPAGAADPFAQTGPAAGTPVVILCDRWEAEDMIRARLEGLGADLAKIGTVTCAATSDPSAENGRQRPIELPRDLVMFDDILRQHAGCRLIVIDNLDACCKSPQEFRAAVKKLDEVAIDHDVAIVATVQRNVRIARDGTVCDVFHKTDSLARSIWSVTPDPSHPGLLRLEPKRMAFCRKPEGLAFRITEAGTLNWEPLPPYRRPPTEAARRREDQAQRAREWLRDWLRERIVPAKEIYDAGSEEGFTRQKLIAARQELGARTVKVGFGTSGHWLWTMLPEGEIDDDELQQASEEFVALMPESLQEALRQGSRGAAHTRLSGRCSRIISRPIVRRMDQWGDLPADECGGPLAQTENQPVPVEKIPQSPAGETSHPNEDAAREKYGTLNEKSRKSAPSAAPAKGEMWSRRKRQPIDKAQAMRRRDERREARRREQQVQNQERTTSLPGATVPGQDGTD